MEKETDKKIKRRRAPVQPEKSTRPISGATNDSLALQRAVGNQGMQQLFESGGLQAKLRTSQPGDAHEQEADRAAEDQARHPGEHPRTLILEDDAESVGPGQMRKREFVSLQKTRPALRPTRCWSR